MGKALYRSYRPKTLDDVVGQEHITTTLKNAMKNGNVSHAYLFTGPRGVGKTSAARILAHEINELEYNEDTDHLDIIEIDAASNRRIDEIRELRDKVHIAPIAAKRKVYIIDEVHMLTREAFNALLKTLEEPPEHAVFILATTELHKVPDTIVSRTQQFSFRTVEQDGLINHLQFIADEEKIPIEADALAIIAEHGRGSFRDSISLLDQIAGLDQDKITSGDVVRILGLPPEQLLVSIVQHVAAGNAVAVLNDIMELRQHGSQPAVTARHLIATLRQQMIDGNAVLDQARSVGIMQALLTITGNGASFEGLELALIDGIASSARPEPSVEPAPAAQKPEPTPEPIPEPMLEPEPAPVVQDIAPEKPIMQAEKPEETKQTKPSQPTGKWDDVLHDLKGTHNTLYGLLRMAEATSDGNEVKLKFKFGFHKKQAEVPKNHTRIVEAVKNVYGENVKISCDVQEAATAQKPAPAKPKKTEDDASLKDISNIFGDAELLES